MKKEEITEELIRSSTEFNNEYDFIKGFFSNLDEITNNQEFLEHYRYVQYWKLPFPKMMEDYASTPNYSLESVIENMRLTGEDEYFTHFEKLFRNIENKYKFKNVFEKENIDEDVFTRLVISGRPDLIDEYLNQGYTPHDIYTYSSNGNATLEAVKIMMNEGYIPSDDIIIWYIVNSMGGLASQCITECSDKEFIFEEVPLDFDSFKMISQEKWIPKISPEEAEELIYKIIESNKPIDVALFKYLYENAKKILSDISKLQIFNHILSTKDRMLISVFLKILDEECFDKNRIEDIIFYTAKSIIGYVIFNLEIKKNKNYENIIDFCCEIEEEEKVNYYKETEEDEDDLLFEKFCETSTDTDEIEGYYSENESERFEESRENSEFINCRYNNYNDSYDDLDDLDDN